jgi:hypothetical protein
MKSSLAMLLALIALGLGTALIAQEERHPTDPAGATAALASDNVMLRKEVAALKKANADRLGMIVDWVRLDPKLRVPLGYTICDGRAISDGPWKGKKTPHLVDRFTMGVPLERLAETGGADRVNLLHGHPLVGQTGGIGTDRKDPKNKVPFNAGRVPGHVGPHYVVKRHHTHVISGTSEKNLGWKENRPKFFGTLKIMCTDPNPHEPKAKNRKPKEKE